MSAMLILCLFYIRFPYRNLNLLIVLCYSCRKIMGMPRKKPKSPPVMSHEFVIQNHADILACVAIVIVLGLVSDVSCYAENSFWF